MLFSLKINSDEHWGARVSFRSDSLGHTHIFRINCLYFTYRLSVLNIKSSFLINLENQKIRHNSASWFCRIPLKVKVNITQYPTLCNHMDYTVHGIFQARILKWVAFPFSRGSSQPRDQTQVSSITGGFFTNWSTREDWVVTIYFLPQIPAGQLYQLCYLLDPYWYLSIKSVSTKISCSTGVLLMSLSFISLSLWCSKNSNS